MRNSIAPVFLAGGLLVLGACSPSTGSADLAQAAPADLCTRPGSRPVPTGRQTGDVRQDYRCSSAHAQLNRETGVRRHGSQLSSAVDRSLRRGG